VLKPDGRVMIALYYKWSAFHLVKWLILNGLCRGWLFTKGYAGLLATIESGADGVHIKPYVKLYTKKAVRQLMSSFSIDDVSIHQIYASHFMPTSVASRLPLLDNFVRLFESSLGWYVSYKGVKIARAGHQ
jgi:hypothetical protein